MGNVTAETRPGATYSYTYDSASRMANFLIGGVQQAAYTYDFAGRQAIRALTSSTIQSVFDSEDRRIAEYDQATGTLIREYVWLGWEPLAVIEGGSIYFVRADHIGRPVFATNSAGTKIWSASYSPFGGTTASSGVPPNMRFPGQWYQSESGLCQNWMRDYDPTTGRYVEADPLGLVDGASVYGYARQNPGRWSDPRGLACSFSGCYTTAEEAKFAHAGQYDKYYAEACMGGDAYACYARHIAANDNDSGHKADWWLDWALSDLGRRLNECIDIDMVKEVIRVKLAQRYADYLPSDQANARWPSMEDVARMHWEVFGEFGMPPNTFGGTPFGASGPYTPPWIERWCPNCK